MAENKARRLPEHAALAQVRYVRLTPMKARRVVDVIRGMKADDALTLLKFAPQAASEPVGKVHRQRRRQRRAQQAAQPARRSWISEAYVDEGPTLKRFRPRAQGRAARIRKRTSHITVIVESREAVVAKTTAKKRRSRARRPPAKKTTAKKTTRPHRRRSAS